jgi:hypothetical protein
VGAGGAAGAHVTTGSAAKPGSSVAWADGGRKPDGGGTGGRTFPEPVRTVVPAIVPRELTWLDVISAAVALIVISIFIVQLKNKSRETSRGDEVNPSAPANTVGIDSLGMDTIGPAVTTPPPVTPAVFLDSIRAQLALGHAKYYSVQYAAAAVVLDDALGRLKSRAAELPEQDRRVLEDTLTNLRSTVRSACATEDTARIRIEKGVPCPR